MSDAMSVDRRLREIWVAMLAVPEVADSDNFVGLGGDSLLAAQCAWRVSRELGVTLPASLLLDDETTFSGFTERVIAAANSASSQH